MAEIKFEITKHIGVLSQGSKGWTKELNLISWNDREPQCDIREWDETHEKMGKGVTLSNEELNGKLGDSKLPIDSVEGYIASKLYGKEPGETVFRRISAISGILMWAGICINEPGALKLYILLS